MDGMGHITFTAPGGARTVCDIEPGQSIMDAAVRNGVDGIVAECGGGCVCGTCHVYLTSGAAEPPTDLETDVLSGAAADVRPESRLGCQVLAQAGEDYEVVIPDRQF